MYNMLLKRYTNGDRSFPLAVYVRLTTTTGNDEFWFNASEITNFFHKPPVDTLLTGSL